ncbi:MAG: two-component system chemotaxis response regulator CheB [Paraglaciecola sp.]|jgi:two-component system chemotaxis response regulator CheB
MAYKVLVVDDSIFFRRRVKQILEQDPGLTVIGEAENGVEAIAQAKLLKPDVITMDIEMPIMDGITAVKQILAWRSVPIMMFSSLTSEGAQATLDALEAGAADFLPKRFEAIASNRQEAVELLQSRVKGLCEKRYGYRPAMGSSGPKAILFNRPSSGPLAKSLKGDSGQATHQRCASNNSNIPSGKHYQCLAIGASTGGPVALQKILTQVPVDFPYPIFVVQHMPGSFTRAFAERLNAVSNITVKEAQHDEAIQSGVAYLAPGGRQMLVVGRPRGAVFRIYDEPVTSGIMYKPSIDLTFESLAKVYAGNVLGLILTGMGADGRIGSQSLKNRGAKIWAQDEPSSVVYGMPQAVMSKGIAEREFSIEAFFDGIQNEMLPQ